MKKGFKKVISLALLIGIGFSSMPISAMSKEETVYVKLNTDGSVQKTLVNEHLINQQKLEEIKDLTDLQNILNLNGNETFGLESNNLLWNAQGKDIFYQGITQKEMPVTLSIQYNLNGEEKSLEEMLGKSGRVSIRLQYQNKDSHMVNVNGRQEVLYTPFVVTTATIIDTENNSNVEVTNGKVVSNGTKNIVVGLATPGLYESLGIDKLKGMDAITISFDTKKFELATIYSIVTPKIIEGEDLKILDKLNSLYGKVNLLESSMNQLEEGANALLSGASQIQNGTSQVYENLNMIVGKLEELKNGVVNVDQGLKQILAKLNETKDLLNGTSVEGLAQIEYLISQNTDAITKLTTANTSLKTTYDSYNLGSVTNQNIMAFTANNYAQAGLPNLSSDQVIEMNWKLVTVKNTYETSYTSNIQLVSLLEGNNQALQKTLTTLQSVNEQVTPLIEVLEGYLKEIEAGTSKLVDGTTQLKEGVALLASKNGELYEGTVNLWNGTNQLASGISKLNAEGIQTLGGYVGSIKNISGKINALVRLGEEYDTFTMKSAETEGKTQFILTVDSAKVKETKKVIKTEKPKESIWTRIKNLF